LAARGLFIFPCAPAAKTPACAHGCWDATTDVITIQAWWRENCDYNIGVATGAASNIFVVDVDGGAAETALRRLEESYGVLPETVEAITPRGRHVYFRYPQTPVRNSAGKLADGIDIRGEGGFVIAPPSMHPSGRRYCWSVDSAKALAWAPQWLVSKITEPAKGNSSATSPADWQELVKGVAEGTRDCSLTKLAGYLLRRRVEPFVVRELLLAFNETHCAPPLPRSDVERIVDSITGRELRRREAGND
jgi:hypothetical protein